MCRPSSAAAARGAQAQECWRLYTKAFYDRKMVDVSPPEIQRVPLAGAVLALKSLPAALGVDVLAFEFVDSPPRTALEEALQQLHLLGAIDAGAVPSSPTSVGIYWISRWKSA